MDEMHEEYTRLSDKIGVPATLEAMAEECSEFQHACLKYSRYLRKENPVHGYDEARLKEQLTEEMADVLLVISEVQKTGLIDYDELQNVLKRKCERMYKLIGVKNEMGDK